MRQDVEPFTFYVGFHLALCQYFIDPGKDYAAAVVAVGYEEFGEFAAVVSNHLVELCIHIIHHISQARRYFMCMFSAQEGLSGLALCFALFSYKLQEVVVDETYFHTM